MRDVVHQPWRSILRAYGKKYEIVFFQWIYRGVVRIFAFDSERDGGICIFNRHAFYSEGRFVCCAFRPVRRQALRVTNDRMGQSGTNVSYIRPLPKPTIPHTCKHLKDLTKL